MIMMKSYNETLRVGEILKKKKPKMKHFELLFRLSSIRIINNFNKMKFQKLVISLFLTAMVYMIPACNNVYTQGIEVLKGKKVLFVYGGWDGHEPAQCRDIFVPWLQAAGAEVIVSDSLSVYKNKDLMNSVDLIVQTWTQGKIDGESSKALLEAVKGGVGLAGWHGGIGDSFRDNVDFQYMVGGQWVAHPGGVIPYEVIVSDKNDPVTKGLSNFKMNSEQYYMHIDPNIKVLATTKFSDKHDSWINGAVIPVVWKKTFGKGRVFYSSLGHVAKDFDVPEALEIMKRGICWAALSKYEKTEEWLKPVY